MTKQLDAPYPKTGLVKLGVSSCLLGEKVRYNAGHAKDDFLLNTLSAHVQWVRICPEFEMGPGVPRETIRLVGDSNEPRLVSSKSGVDHTDSMKAWSKMRLFELADMDLMGYVFKKDSPNCGLFRARVYAQHGVPPRPGRGLFAKDFVDNFPGLPVEEEGRLHDAKLRENFITRVFAYHRWRAFVRLGLSVRGLVDFHAAHKMMLMAHHPAQLFLLGRIVADAGRREINDVANDYLKMFMESLGSHATNRKHTNVLQYLMGYLKKHIDNEDKNELLTVIEQYHQGMLPLIVPITLLQHHLRRNPVPDWVIQQTYLNPYPQELMLRNHV